MKLIGPVAIPIDRLDSQATNFVNRLREYACVIEVAEEQIDRLEPVGILDLPEQFLGDLRPVHLNKASLSWVVRYNVLKGLVQIIVELNDLVAQTDQR